MNNWLLSQIPEMTIEEFKQENTNVYFITTEEDDENENKLQS